MVGVRRKSSRGNELLEVVAVVEPDGQLFVGCPCFQVVGGGGFNNLMGALDPGSEVGSGIFCRLGHDVVILATL